MIQISKNQNISYVLLSNYKNVLLAYCYSKWMSCFWSWLATELITVKEGNDKNDVVSWITIVSHSHNHMRSSPFTCRDMQQQWFNYLISDFKISKKNQYKKNVVLL